jgi:hypothetical protein
MPLFGIGGDTLEPEEPKAELPPVRAFVVQLTDGGKAVNVRAHTYDVPNGSLIFAEYIDLGDGKAAIVVADAFAPGVWKRFREVPTNEVSAKSDSVN